MIKCQNLLRNVGTDMKLNHYAKIIINNNEIYSYNKCNNSIVIYEKIGKITKFNELFTQFDMYRNYIYIYI